MGSATISTSSDAACSYGTPLCPVGHKVPLRLSAHQEQLPTDTGLFFKYNTEGSITANISQNQWFSWADNSCDFRQPEKAK